MFFLTAIRQSRYYQDNKAVILLLFAWMFRLCFLMQGNAGMSLNKYVLLQIALMLVLAFHLFKLHFYPTILFKHTSTKYFALIYVFGMVSIFWSVLPLMSCYFAFENLMCMTALLYLAMRCRDKFQLEYVFIVMTIVILGMFLARVATGGLPLHSVEYSTIAAMLLTYCLGEYGTKGRSEENRRILKWGVGVGGTLLLLTTSSGAMVSTAVALIALALFAQNRTVRMLALFCIILAGVLWFSGSADLILDILFPGKEIDSMDEVLEGHGRGAVWEMINEKVAERPWFGWGYAAVERVLPLYCIDAHNSIVGIRGSLGNVGCGCLIVSMILQLKFLFKNASAFGFRGLFVATVCAFVNSNTTNFLAAKAHASPLVFQFLLILGASYWIFSRRDTVVQQ